MKQVTQKYIAWLSWRRPWVWLLAILLIYPFVLAVIAPLVIKNQLEDLVENRLQLELDVADISVHPYVLSLSIKDVKISGENLGEPIGFEQLFVNFQLWDSLQGTWTLKEAHLTGVYGEFKRLTKETHNFTNVINTWVATEEKKSKEKKAEEKKPEEKSAEAIDEPAEFPRVRIDDLRLQIAAFKFIDDVPKSGFETAIGPIDFHIEQLSSLPNTAGQQTLLLKTVAGAELAWQGSISLSPFSSEGDVILIGPILTTLADYLKDDINVAVTTDNFQAGFHYVINKPEQGDLKIQLSGIEASLRELSVKHHPTNDSLFLLNDIQVSDGELSWPESSIRLGKIQLTGGEVWAKMSLDGNLNFSQLVAADDNDDEQESTWQLANDSLLIQGITLHYLDESSTSPAPVAVENISLDVKNLSNKPEQRVDVNAGFSLLGGQFESTARAQLNPFGDAEGTYKIAQLPVKAAQSFIDDYAAIEIMSGELDAEGKITTSNNAVKIQGNAHIDNVNVREKSNGKTILTWAQLKLNRIIANLDEKKINLGRVQFDQAFADFDIAADGTHTLTRILKIDEPTPETDEPENASSTQASSTDTSSFSFLIGRIDFENASGNFSDATLPLPFSADVAKINGTISTLDSTSHAPAKVKLEGQVSDYGEMVMTGDIFPLEPKQKTRMNVNFNNIDISEFSPYAIKFAGREIAKGKMDLDLEYDINQSRMRGKNHIVLHDFALGKKVEQAGAVDLPLDLAIALLKDKDGVIRTDLPVEGNVDDPKFDYGTTIRQAVRKLITNVAAAPFRFLAGLVGVGQNKDLGYISFFAGRTDLSPAQNEKIKQLGEALIKRPDLQITISGVYLASFDTAELQEEKFEARLREQLSKGLADANIGSRKYISTMEKLYSEKGLTPDLNELKRNAQRLATDDNQNVDQLSYIKAVKDKLVATEIITQEDLLQLAASRAQVLYQNLTQIPQVNAAQIKMGEAREGQLNKDNKIKLELGANLKKKTKAKKT